MVQDLYHAVRFPGKSPGFTTCNAAGERMQVLDTSAGNNRDFVLQPDLEYPGSQVAALLALNATAARLAPARGAMPVDPIEAFRRE